MKPGYVPVYVWPQDLWHVPVFQKIKLWFIVIKTVSSCFVICFPGIQLLSLYMPDGKVELLLYWWRVIGVVRQWRSHLMLWKSMLYLMIHLHHKTLLFHLRHPHLLLVLHHQLRESPHAQCPESLQLLYL